MGGDRPLKPKWGGRRKPNPQVVKRWKWWIEDGTRGDRKGREE